LTELNLSNNQVIKIENLPESLTILYLSYNQITKIESLPKSLTELYLSYNQITELPLELLELTNLRDFNYGGNPIEYISLPVQRWLMRFDHNLDNNKVYSDKQNIHSVNIQKSFRNSLSNIIKDRDVIQIESLKIELLDNTILSEETKREILNYCDYDDQHSIYLLTYSELLCYVWTRIMKHSNRNDILEILNQEIKDGICMCFTGRLTRLLNVLVGFYDDIEIQISDSEQITNIILSLQKKYSGDQLKDEFKKELLERQYTETIINEWLEYI